MAGGDLSLSPLDLEARVWRPRSSGMEATISGFRASDVVELSVSRKRQALHLRAIRVCGELKDPVWYHRTGVHTV